MMKATSLAGPQACGKCGGQKTRGGKHTKFYYCQPCNRAKLRVRRGSGAKQDPVSADGARERLAVLLDGMPTLQLLEKLAILLERNVGFLGVRPEGQV